VAAAIVFEHGECLCSQRICRGFAASDILAHNRRLPSYVHSLLMPLVVRIMEYARIYLQVFVLLTSTSSKLTIDR
jgi:hypothetical protein